MTNSREPATIPSMRRMPRPLPKLLTAASLILCLAQPGDHPQPGPLTPNLSPEHYHTAWGGEGCQLNEPLWLLILLTSIAPILRAIKILRPRPISPTQCQTCGYDLRATPTRCPECGSAAPIIGEGIEQN
jgi:hypothetical protein